MHQVRAIGSDRACRRDCRRREAAPVAGVRRVLLDTGGSCALGAAYEGAYALPQEAGSIRPRLDRLFDCLENVRRRCPVGCNKRLPLNSIILHLNDDHQWTREQIVEWLRTVIA